VRWLTLAGLRADTTRVRDGGWRLGHRPGLDGLRGVAVALVIAAHACTGVFPSHRPLAEGVLRGGGIVGVQLFFVLSGFLITRLLLEELDASGSIRLGAFYGRRVRRLLPALVALCVIYVAVAWIAGRPNSPAAGSAITALLYVENFARWVPIDQDGWLGHTWSLAVEEQFYLAWPALLAVGVRFGG